MELRQLKYFIKTAETLSFSEASKALCITQSTLSQQIKQLETELGTPLFIRSSHSVSLTEAGDSFSPILTETLIMFRKMYPDIKLNICYRPMAELMELLKSREVDFVLAFRPWKPEDGVESHILFQNYLAAIVAEGHPLAEKESVTLSELQRYDLALPSRGLQARNAFELIKPAGYDFRIKIELNEVNILLKIIRQTMLVSVLAEATIHNESGIKAIHLDFPENELAGCVHTLRGTYRKRAAQEFIRLLSESMAVRERQNDWI